MLFSLIASLSVLMALAAWVGWRYFLPSPDGGKVARTFRASQSDAPPGRARRHGGARQRMLAHWPLWIAVLLAGAAVTGVLSLSGRILSAPLQASEFNRLENIQSALNPEALAPPPLPPAVFAGTGRPGLEAADRDWAKLNRDFAKLALLVFARTEARGYPFALLEGYRSPERQDVLAASPEHVTNAGAFQSKHQYGLALDAAPLRDGRLVISERDPWAMAAYRALGEEAEKLGLVWGGRWKLRDFGHIESPLSIAVIAQEK
jgi:peptidoglycan L-alanyl-D-glutamate endopeptidase CwlK